MRQYQEQYISNTKRVKELLGNYRQEVPTERLYEQKLEDHLEIGRRREDSMQILREQLVPLLDDILNADAHEIADLEEFADALMKGQLDNALQYQVCSALIVYARTKGDRDLLIKELYMAGMAAFNIQKMPGQAVADRFRWKLAMFFGEAAGFIRYYDEIESTETRGYIHRSMANMALAYAGNDAKNCIKKMDVIRRSLQVLNDSAYHKKTPDLPWDLFIYKSHQERTSLLGFLRSEEATVQHIREVMESAQFVYERQVENADRKGAPLEPQWVYAYYAASYHGGIHTLEEFLQNLETVYTSVSITDYSQQGMYGNVYIPAVYAVYMEKDEQLCRKKKPVVLTMYRRLVQYVRQVPGGRFNDALFFYIRCSLDTYIEYPGEYSFRDFLEEMVACRQPETYVHSLMTAKISQAIFHRTLEREPERLIGVRGCGSVEELLARREELDRFLYDCAILHDIGKMKLLDVYEVQHRGWIAEEGELHHLHPVLGCNMLQKHSSTRELAAAALGHHRWYDGQGGYPEEYHREEAVNAALVDILCVAHYIDRRSDVISVYQGKTASLEEVFEEIEKKSGSVLAPHFVETALGLRREIRDILQKSRIEAYRSAYEMYR